ncbi:Protein of unknown function [Propionibacterium freudenreichii]|nr:Protein of unknown function [Propionibacterium freudenreichii]
MAKERKVRVQRRRFWAQVSMAAREAKERNSAGPVPRESPASPP